MGRASLKSNEPIRLPHDGPLHNLLLQQQEKDNEHAREEGQDEVLRMALSCLQNGPSVNDDSNHDVDQQSIVGLLASLQQAKTIKEQLQTLQTFRSKSKQQQQQKDSTESSDASVSYRRVLYRILMEWFLSIQTPVPLRRAIQANLDGLTAPQLQHDTSQNDIACHVLTSILVVVSSNNHWQQPLHSLHEALNYKVTHDLLILTSHNKPLANQLFAFLHHYAKQQILPILETTLSNHPTTKLDENIFFVEQEVTRAIQQAIQWAGILKTVLADAPPSLIILHDNDDDMLEFSESFLHQIMTCRMVPVDSLSNLGMAYSRVVLMLRRRKQVQDDDLAQLVDNLVAQQLSDMTTIAMIQGLAATAPIKVMLHTSRCFMQYFRRLAHHSDPGVRLVALKGIHTLISRCYTLCIATTATTPVTTSELEAIQYMTEGTLEMVLAAWENPPNRRLGSAIQSLFQKLIALMQELGQQQ
ncbi:Putative death-receptor fusion protein (DUF2428) (Partial), partial [Seminavis robusta]|eukprot:Sro346_g122800.1 Putative death-receptor fusion protein (DUF2428) (470) ;mRNA; f:73551-74961